MTDEDIVARAARIFGVKYFVDRSRTSANKTPYIVSIKGRRAVKLMKDLYPLMGKRRQEQIDRAVEGYVYHKGEHHPLSKLTERQVKQIKERLARGECASSIADELGLGRSTIFDIKRGLTWKYVTIGSDNL